MAAAPGRVRLGTSDRYWDCRRARHQIMSAQNAHIWTASVMIRYQTIFDHIGGSVRACSTQTNYAS